MEVFEPGDRVVAIDTDMSRMVHPAGRGTTDFKYPDGLLRKDVIYHVAAIKWVPAGQGLYLKGLRSFRGDREVAWGAVRFRKFDSLRGHMPAVGKQPRLEPAHAFNFISSEQSLISVVAVNGLPDCCCRASINAPQVSIFCRSSSTHSDGGISLMVPDFR